MKKYEKFCIFLFIVSLVPIIWVSFYSFPNADDFGFGSLTHLAFVQHGILSMLKTAVFNVYDFYMNWQGTYSAIFLFSLQPGIFSEHLYFISHFILLGAFIAANIFFLQKIFQDLNKHVKYLLILLVLFVQIQFVYDAVSSFYWYNGSIYYTFFYSLELVLYRLLLDKKQKWHLIYPLAIFIAGSNFVTVLNLILILSLYNIYCLHHKEKNIKLLILLMLVVFCFGISVLAPGNQVRAAYYSQENLSAISAIVYSFPRAIIYSFKLFNVASFVSILILLVVLKDTYTKFQYRYPIVVLLLLFGIFAAHFTAPLYAMGFDNLWSRIINIISFKGYYLMLFALYYLIGYFKMYRYFNLKWIRILSLIFIVGFILNSENSLTYKATFSLISGQAEEYKQIWLDRLSILNDESIQNVHFQSIPVRPEPIFFMDGNDDGDDWIQRQMADYYQKESVHIDR